MILSPLGLTSLERLLSLSMEGISVASRLTFPYLSMNHPLMNRVHIQVKGAQELGAAGVLIYSDPRDDGSVTTDNGYQA